MTGFSNHNTNEILEFLASSVYALCLLNSCNIHEETYFPRNLKIMPQYQGYD